MHKWLQGDSNLGKKKLLGHINGDFIVSLGFLADISSIMEYGIIGIQSDSTTKMSGDQICRKVFKCLSAYGDAIFQNSNWNPAPKVQNWKGDSESYFGLAMNIVRGRRDVFKWSGVYATRDTYDPASMSVDINNSSFRRGAAQAKWEVLYENISESFEEYLSQSPHILDWNCMISLDDGEFGDLSNFPPLDCMDYSWAESLLRVAASFHISGFSIIEAGIACWADLRQQAFSELQIMLSNGFKRNEERAWFRVLANNMKKTQDELSEAMKSCIFLMKTFAVSVATSCSVERDFSVRPLNWKVGLNYWSWLFIEIARQHNRNSSMCGAVGWYMLPWSR